LLPLVFVSGTCMNSGKTFVCSQLMQELSKQGRWVHGGKLSGVAWPTGYHQHGGPRRPAAAVMDLVGYASTAGLATPWCAWPGPSPMLSDGDPDLIFLELGDG
jgi:dethiobiotin synthetase